jgi:hypothetical protein
MTYTLQKAATADITPSQGGRLAVGQMNGLEGYNPQRLTGFYPTEPYAAVRTFVDGDGNVALHPENYQDYRLNAELLTQSPPMGREAITQIVENRMRGHFDPAQPYVFMSAMFNVWYPSWPQPVVGNVPGSYLESLLNGWDAGATTYGCFSAAGKLVFSADAGTYAAVGLSGDDASAVDPHTVDHGFLIRGPQAVQAIERGVVSALNATVYPGAGATFTVEVVEGVVRYLVNGTLRFTSTTARPASTVFRGLACLYGATSRIIGAAVTQYSGSTLRLPTLQARSRGAGVTIPALTASAGWLPFATLSLPALRSVGGRSGYAYSETRMPLLETGGPRRGENLRMPLLTMVAGNYTSAKLRLRLVAAGSDYAYGSAATSMPAIKLESVTGRPRPIGGMGTLPRLRGISSGLTRSVGRGAVTLPALTVRSANYSQATISLRPFIGLGYEDPANEAFVSGVPFAAAAQAAVLLVAVVMDAAGNVTGAFVIGITQDADIDGEAVVTDAVTTSATLEALMQSFITGAVTQLPFMNGGEPGSMTWVINADTMATSRYENYSFNSFGVVDGVAYGARGDGLYSLSGADDAGQPIRASLAFGSTDFKSQNLKRLEHAYVGLSSSGTMFLKVSVNGQSYIYEARRSDDYMAMQRVDVGRGIRASYMAFELYNQDGCDFELNTVSFYAADLTRRI